VSQSAPRVAAAREGALLAQRREDVARSLSGRFWLRFHATLIVAGTFATGFLANFALLGLGLTALLPRWLGAIAIAYAGFFLLVRFWLAYVGVRQLAPGAEGADASSSASPSSSSSSSSSSGGIDVALPELPWHGGGGRFGGAGATGDFAPPRAAGLAELAPAKSSSTVGKGVGALVDGVDDMLPVVLSLVVLALVAALVGSAVAFVWMAPDLLSDAAFAALLASGMLPGIARAKSGDWHGRLFAATWKPLAGVVVVAVGAALALMHWFPGARTLGDAWKMLG